MRWVVGRGSLAGYGTSVVTRALVLDSRQVALDLHALLRDIDPAHLRGDEVDGGVRERIEAIQERLTNLLETTWPDESVGPVQLRMAELARVLRDHVPRPDHPAPVQRQHLLAMREQLQPVYEGLATSLRAWSIHVPSLRPSNYRRNAFHVACAIGVILLVQYVLVTPGRLIGVALLGAAMAWSMEISRRFSPAINRFLMAVFAPVAHPHEAHRVNSATWYATSLVILATGFDPLAGVVALAVLGVGDPTAAIVGRRFGRVRLIHGRSLEGTLAFFVSGLLASLLVLRLWHAELPWALTLGMCAGGAALGALGELFARRIDDNLAVPVAAAMGAALVAGVF